MNISVKKITEAEGHRAAIYTLSESFKENEFLSAGSERFVASWDLEHIETAHVAAKAAGVIYSLLALPEYQLLLTGTDQGNIHVIDVHKNQEIKNIIAHEAGVFDLLQVQHKSEVISAGADGTMQVWSLPDFKLVKSLKLSDGKIRQLALSAQNNLIAAACADGIIRLIDSSNYEIIREFQAHNMAVNTVCFSPQGDVLLSGGKDAMLNVWSLPETKLIKSIPAHNYAIYSIVFHPAGKWFATGSRDKTIKIWNPDDYSFLIRIEKEIHGGHINSVNKIIWSRFNNYLISAGDDRRIIVWEIE